VRKVFGRNAGKQKINRYRQPWVDRLEEVTGVVALGAYRNQRELRKQPRKLFGRPAWIDLGKGAALLLCTVYDVSDTGAGVKLATDDRLPARFTLLFSPTGRPGRRCRVVWQDGHRLGCEFVERPPLKRRC
jgi:PilZ domain